MEFGVDGLARDKLRLEIYGVTPCFKAIGAKAHDQDSAVDRSGGETAPRSITRSSLMPVGGENLIRAFVGRWVNACDTHSWRRSVSGPRGFAWIWRRLFSQHTLIALK